MKRTRKQTATIPKCRVMRADPYLLNAYTFRVSADAAGIVPSPDRKPAFVLVQPFPTARQAQAAKRFWGMTEEQRVAELNKLALTYCGPKPGSTAYIEECVRRFSLSVLALIAGENKA